MKTGVRNSPRWFPDKNRRYRNKGGRKFCASLRKFCKHNGHTPPFITNKYGRFRANPANFAQMRSILFLSTIWDLHPLVYIPFCAVPIKALDSPRIIQNRFQQPSVNLIHKSSILAPFCPSVIHKVSVGMIFASTIDTCGETVWCPAFVVKSSVARRFLRQV